MSTLTKVLTVLVSLLAIFLSGVVVVFVGNTTSWKEAYDQQKGLTSAAQTHAAVQDQTVAAMQSRHEAWVTTMQSVVAGLQQQNTDLLAQREEASRRQADAEGKAQTAVAVSSSLSGTIDKMRETRDFIQQKLETAHADKLRAEAQAVEMTQELNRQRALGEQLKLALSRNEERIKELENENALVRQRLEQVTLASSESRPMGDQVRVSTPQAGRVPIRGEIVDVRDERAEISVGSSSGVRENMEFNVIRGNQFLGNLVVTHVQGTRAAGTLVRQQGAIVKGDKVSSGFD